MLIVESPIPNFVDTDGSPLNAGYLYFGVVNQNPETNPITVYWDSALTQPAVQPIRTIDGVIVRDGSPANVYSNGAYSITVRNKNSILVYSFADSAQFDNSVNLNLQITAINATLANFGDSANMAKGVALIGGANRNVATIAVLRTLPKTGAPYAFVLGYYAAGDGGGGMYYYDSTDTSSVDNGGSVIVAADGGRWKLCETKEYSVKQFGAKGDGTTDDKAAIQAAIATGKAVYIPATTNGYKISSRLSAIAGTKIRGDWKKTKIILGTAGEWCIEITGSEVVIEGLKFDCTVGAGGGVFLLRSDLTSMERIYIRDIESTSATGFCQDLFHASNIIVLLQFQRCIARLHRGGGMDLRQTFAYLLVEDVTFDYVGSSAHNFQAVQLRNNRGSMWNRVDVTGGVVDATTTSNDAFFFSNCVAVWMTDCMADTVGGNGFYLYGQNRAFYMVNCVASLCGKVGFALGSTGGTSYDLVLSNCSCFGRRGQAYAPVYAGYQLDSTNKVQLTGCKSQDNAGAGFYLNAATRSTISGCRADTNTGRGVDSAGTGSCLIAASCFDANTGGNANMSSANMNVSNCQASSGALFSITGPGSA